MDIVFLKNREQVVEIVHQHIASLIFCSHESPVASLCLLSTGSISILPINFRVLPVDGRQRLAQPLGVVSYVGVLAWGVRMRQHDSAGQPLRQPPRARPAPLSPHSMACTLGHAHAD